jgi:hypothetical protein
VEEIEMRVHKYYKAYRHCKYDAKNRGIDFLLTFEEWLAIWEDSGYLAERGCRRGQYVMARFGDEGPYIVGNVEIILATQNVSAGRRGKKASPQTRAKLRLRKPAMLGKKFSTEARERMSRAQKKFWSTNVLSDETRQRISMGQKRRRMRERKFPVEKISLEAVWFVKS